MKAFPTFVLLWFTALAAASAASAQCDPTMLFPVTNPALRTGDLSYSVAFGDFNGDGAPDLAVANASSDDVSILLNQCGAAPCPGDIADDFGTLGADGMVSFGDFLALLGLIGPCPGGTPGCVGDIADDFGTLNGGDGIISFGDFLALLGLIGPCP